MAESGTAETNHIANIPIRTWAMLAAGVLALTAVITIAAGNLRSPEYSVLFANLSNRDGGVIIESLTKQNIPYRFTAGGGAIMVPSDQVHAARLRLASEGLPRGASIGFELMDTQGFGVTQFQERLNFQRGLQGELTRTIESLAAVESARVHLAIPNNAGFLRSQQQASASVMLRLYPSRFLNRGQVAGIVHLVSASLERLSPENVAVIDQNGTLLSQKTDLAGTPDASQIAYVHNVESRLSQRIVELLEPVVGRGNVRAQVSANIDFTETQSTDETYRPNQGNQAAAVRSQQIRSQGSADGAAGAGGIPGALTNQPGGPAAAPVNGPAQNPQAAANQAGGGADAKSSRESVVNYEVDKSVRVTRNGKGTVQRLSAAVVINHRRSVDDAGNVTYTPLTAEELESMNALVRQAIGFTEDRGDTINIMNSQFTEEPASEVPELPLWKDPQITSLALQVLKHAGLVLLGLLTILMVIRPAIRNLAPPPPTEPDQLAAPEPGSQLDETIADELELPAPSAPTVIAPDPQEILQIARQSPAAVAHVVRAWVNDMEGAEQ